MADSKLNDMTEETTPAHNDELYLYDVSGTDDNKVLVRNLFRAHIGTAFPSSNLYDGYLFFRTDIDAGMLCFYDQTNTQWLTVTEYTAEVSRSGIGAAEERDIIEMGSYAPYITRIVAKTKVSTTNDGSNYWTLKVQGENLARDTESDVYSVNTSADSADTWTDHSGAADTAAPTNYIFLITDVAKTLSPGNIDYTVTMHYRYVIT